MQLSIHYYVLSLGKRTSSLYEGFRDSLIDIQNTRFPFEVTSHPSKRLNPASKAYVVQEFLTETDRHLAHYFAQDPLWILLMGRRKYLSIFKSISKHGQVFIGELEGDFASVSPQDLGKLTWPVIKKVLAGSNGRWLQELEAAAETTGIITGFDAVSQSVNSESVLSLFVEEDFHVKGSIYVTDEGLAHSPDVDVDAVIDDAVDILIEKVLAKGGDVVFLDRNTMKKFQRIALILRS